MSFTRKVMLIGHVVRKLAPKISLVEVQTNQLDESIYMYFGRYNNYRADDGPHNIKVNDYVMIKSKDNPERIDLVYEVADVVVRAGVARDPFTGRRLVGENVRIDYLEDTEKINSLLPDRGDCQKTLKYSEEDMTVGIPQSPKDHS